MFIDFLTEVFEENRAREAIVWKDRGYDYAWLGDRVDFWRTEIQSHNVRPGSVVIVEGDFSPNSIALFLALVDAQCILVPLTSAVRAKKSKFIEIAQGEMSFALDRNDNVEIKKLPNTAEHEHYAALRGIGHPGIVVFSSGSTGESKAAVHDMTRILRKFNVRRHRLRAITFLLYDHLGGINTMLYQLSNGGCIVTVQERGPDSVLRAIERHKVELLPTSPTFINLILLSEAYKRYDLSALKTVSYGTEPMPPGTLRRFRQVLPEVRMLQTYGLSEIGVLRSKSKSSDSLWVQVGGEGFETRVVDGILQVKAESAMLGYLNAESPLTKDGWMDTGDRVEVDGEYLRILGRESDVINIGGEKVYPAEVEAIVQEMDNVGEVVVYGEKNIITGNIVCARVRLLERADSNEFAAQLKSYCRARLKSHEVPVRVKVVYDKQYTDRFKKARVLDQELST